MAWNGRMKEPNGIILIDKPRGMTSHDVVARIRKVAGMKRVGHTGTLDPMADGLMVVCLGPATRISQFLVGLDKVYTGQITLGGISSTYDAEGEITLTQRPVPNDPVLIREAMQQQCGERIQLPPPYSAIKVKGKKLYEYARAGEEVPQKPRTVHVHRFDLVAWESPLIEFEARVGSGTYIRSMAHDLGLSLDCGGYLSELRRTAVGSFEIGQAANLADLIEDPMRLGYYLLSVTEALSHLPKLTLTPSAEQAHLHGQPFTTRDIMEFEGVLLAGQPVLVLGERGDVISVVRGESPDEAGDVDYEVGATPLLFKAVRVLARP